jgi:hypothetical protein
MNLAKISITYVDCCEVCCLTVSVAPFRGAHYNITLSQLDDPQLKHMQDSADTYAYIHDCKNACMYTCRKMSSVPQVLGIRDTAC